MLIGFPQAMLELAQAVNVPEPIIRFAKPIIHFAEPFLRLYPCFREHYQHIVQFGLPIGEHDHQVFQALLASV